MKKDILQDAIEDQKLQIHRDHRDWKNKLEFYSSEIRFFQKELDKVMQVNNSDLSVIEHVKEYQKILEKKKIIIEELQEEIKYQKKIFDVDEIVPENISYHLLLKERFEKFVLRIEELKPNFKRYTSHRD
jgi:hypothetical protein